jgi:hypothetical protein|tara:strand:+ start:2168 stop:2725 length:558 start_codon:yes stop_codon:yes gene_type:complete
VAIVVASHQALLHDLRKALYGPDRSVQESYISLAWDGARNFLKEYVPSIDAYIPVTGDIENNFVKFVEWSTSNNQSMDWRIGLIAYKYLHEQQGVRDRLLCQECMLSAASQWCYLDKSRMLSCVIQSRECEGLSVLGEKSTDAAVERGLYLLDTDKTCERDRLFTLKFFVGFSDELDRADAELRL